MRACIAQQGRAVSLVHPTMCSVRHVVDSWVLRDKHIRRPRTLLQRETRLAVADAPIDVCLRGWSILVCMAVNYMPFGGS
jgi:hypothetical protein